MTVKFEVFRSLYQDSVSLMQIAASIRKQANIEQASVVMGTATNLQQLADANLSEGVEAGPNDLVVAVRGSDEACDAALALARERLTARPAEMPGEAVREAPLTSLAMARERTPQANMALISVPGEYAAAEALKALELGMHVMLFSDNVSLAQEKAVKTLARERGLIVMGPDCGTAIVNGMPLGFANVVRRGGIGIVAASGTGLQEVSCRIDQLGFGISQALGTGGHDLHEEIGGISMLYGIDALAQDPATRVIVLVSKPPAADVAQRVLERAQAARKPVVVNFLGAAPDSLQAPGIQVATTLADAAECAVALLAGTPLPDSAAQLDEHHAATLGAMARALPPGRRFLRGVFAGGTFCYETQLLCRDAGLTASSNTPVAGNARLADIWHSIGHTVVDMGDDDFTRGRPHPMIDPTLRDERMLAELLDPEVAVVVFDLVLGYGAAADPVAGIVAAIATARAGESTLPVMIAHVCGTEDDPQVRSRQIEALREAGVLVAGCNAQAARSAAHVASLQATR